jgi:Transposase DDE domain group 1
VHGIGGRSSVVDPALAWSANLSVKVGGAGTVAHAGVVLPRLLGDRLGLTADLSGVLARAGFIPGRDRGRALVDAACALAAGATCLSDIEAMTRQVEIFGPDGGASDTTMLRVLDELAGRLRGDGLPGRRLARAIAGARSRAWTQIVARHGQLPSVKVAGTDLSRPARAGEQCDQKLRPVLVVRLDATLIEAESNKSGAAGTYKGGYGFHPLTAWCTNVGDSLAVMLRPGNAGSFTASDHVLVLDAAIAQIPAEWRKDVLVTIDGAGASHEVIDHLSGLNTVATQGKRGRRVEYSIGWPVDERTQGALAQLRERDWDTALGADGNPDPDAAVVDLTGILRHGPNGDRMSTWPKDVRVIARRVPRPAGEQAKLGENPSWRYGAFATNTTSGQIQWLDARHRTQAHVEDKIKELKACGAENLPSIDWNRNSAWLHLAALATSLNAWLRHLALDGQLARAEPKALRYRLLGAPARHVTHARKKILKIPPGWAFANDVVNAWDRLQALHPA